MPKTTMKFSWQRKGSISLQNLTEGIFSSASHERLGVSLRESPLPSVGSRKGEFQRPKAPNQFAETEIANGDETSHYVSGFRLYLIIVGLSLSVLLVALDNAILATAVPTITTSFHSLNDVGWYGSAFLITICACQPLSGKIYQQFPLKWAYLSFLAIFEIGSLVCATSPSSIILIIGRAIAGLGAAGLFSGALVIIAHTIPLRQRPLYMAIIASMFGVANLVGPVLGGALTQHASWRWCFYINLPCGGVTTILLFFFFSTPIQNTAHTGLINKLKHLDLPGFLLFVPAVVMLLLALQWGGNVYPWRSATVIGLICGSACTISCFALWQWHEQDEASIPPAVFTQRSVFFGAIVAGLAMGGLQLVTYYLPIWFQVIKDSTPTKSGIMYFPSVLGDLVFSVSAGLLVTKLGYYNPWLLFGTALTAIGAGLYSTLKVHTGSAAWIGYQVISGAGIGCILQMPLIAVQAVLPLRKVATGTSIIVFFQFFGGAMFLAIAHNVFQSRLLHDLTMVKTENAQAIIKAGATAVRRITKPEDLSVVLKAYDRAITDTFIVTAAGGALAFLAAACMEWVSVKGQKFMGGGEA